MSRTRSVVQQLHQIDLEAAERNLLFCSAAIEDQSRLSADEVRELIDAALRFRDALKLATAKTKGKP